MKAISLWQPWASWVANNWKTIETRDHDKFKNLVGQRIAIHAAQKVDHLAFQSRFFIKKHTLAGLKGFMIEMNRNRGHIICTCLVTDGEWAKTDCRHPPGWDDAAMINTSGKYLLFLNDIVKLNPPIACRGRQGIFEVDIPLL